ncbi:MAG: alkaline phytoceramidase [Acidobacteria bacterium]|nr:MAG: alkaline phytoceramidase [Acidobacteriota bacterium]
MKTEFDARAKLRPSFDGRWLAGATALIAMAFLMMLPPIRLDPAYHQFSDQRALFKIPNFWNVASNLPFVAVGLWGLRVVFRNRVGRGFEFPFERWAYAVLFAAVAMIGVGSAYYHLRPNARRLVWDRLPMSVGFMALFAAAIAEFVDPRLGFRLLVPLVAVGGGSVFLWHWTLMRGREDLRLYTGVQFLPLIEILFMLALLPGRYTHQGYYLYAIALYGLAKVFEVFDRPIFAAGRIVSGHTLKHLAAATGVAIIERMLMLRQPKSAPGGAPAFP